MKIENSEKNLELLGDLPPLSCEFRGRYFRESRIESQFRGRYFREIRIEGQFREKIFSRFKRPIYNFSLLLLKNACFQKK